MNGASKTNIGGSGDGFDKDQRGRTELAKIRSELTDLKAKIEELTEEERGLRFTNAALKAKSALFEDDRKAMVSTRKELISRLGKAEVQARWFSDASGKLIEQVDELEAEVIRLKEKLGVSREAQFDFRVVAQVDADEFVERMKKK